MYNDLHGFIRYRRSHRSHSAEFFAGQKAGEAGCYDQAIKHFTTGLALLDKTVVQNDAWRRHMARIVLQVRGLAHLWNKSFPSAIEDLTRSMAPGQENARVYWHRAQAHMGLQAWPQAQEDLSQEGVITLFHEEYPSLLALEEDLKVEVPRAIAERLMSPDALEGDS